MKIKKLLIVPADSLVENEPASPYAAFLFSAAKYVKRSIAGMPSVYDAELQRYADIPKILGQENTLILGRYYPHFHLPTPPPASPYPSLHGTPPGRAVGAPNLAAAMPEVDALLVSVRAGARRDIAVKEARKRDIPIAMIDAFDHQSNYGAADIRKELCRGFKKGEHFDLYFKADLPLGYASDYILPLAPVPLRPESYQFSTLPKNISIFYSGKHRIKGQPDGAEIVDAVGNNFDNAVLLDHSVGHKTFLTNREYWDYLSRSLIALSPSRFVWDSFRHCEAGLAPGTALVAPRPYVETTGPALRDGVNALLYETELRSGKRYLVDGKGFVEKIKYYLARPQELVKVAEAWHKDVLAGHTILARSKYILKSMEEAF